MQWDCSGDTMAADFYVTADGGSESEVAPVAKAIQAEGFTVETGVTGPNAEALRNQGTVKPPTKLVFICNGGIAGQTYGSFALDYSDGMCFTIIAFDNYRTHFDTTTEKGLKEMELVSEHDSGGFATSEIAQDIKGHTTCSYQQKYPQVFAFVTDETSAENLGKKIAHGEYTCGEGDGMVGSGTTSSGGSAQVRDKTFERCIRRICAATDSIFLVENNAAVLFPYVDWMAFTLRHKIGQISAKDMDPDLFEIDYTTDGFYNKVTVVWGADEEEEETTENKQEDEEEETIGNVTTIQKKMPTGGTRLSEQYDPLVKIYGELEKKVTTNFPNEETAHFVMNALLIQYIRDFNNSCRCRVINNQKFVGGTFYAVENPITNESELFYLNSYTMFRNKKQPLTTDMEFKYGPEGAEELLDYQNFGGGSSSGGATGSGTPTDEPQAIKELVNQICQGISDAMQKMIAIHNYLKDHITYSPYDCTHYDTPEKCLQHIGGLNCADTARLTRSCMGAAGLDAQVVHGDRHFWTIITINGKEYASDAVSAYHDIGDVWQPSGTSHFNDGGPYYKKNGQNPDC